MQLPGNCLFLSRLCLLLAPVRDPVINLLNGVNEQWAACYFVAAWTQQLLRARVVNVAPAGTSAVKLSS